MAKKSDILDIKEQLAELSREDDLGEKLHELEKNEAVREAIRLNNWWWIKKLVAMCLTMWSMIYLIGSHVGSWLYHNSVFVRSVIDFAVTAWSGRNE